MVPSRLEYPKAARVLTALPGTTMEVGSYAVVTEGLDVFAEEYTVTDRATL